MARYRIKQVPSVVRRGAPLYQVEKRGLLFWKVIYFYCNLELAESYVEELLKEDEAFNQIETKIIKEYN